MLGEIDRGIRRDRDGAGPDRDMRGWHADEIDHERHSEDRAAATDETQEKSDQRARAEAQQSG